MGATIHDILIGLLIGNTLAVLSFWLITAPIAVKTRLSLYTYLERNMGELVPRLYNGANVLIFVAISAAMITVSATAVRALFDIPPQIYPYPTSVWFAVIAASASVESSSARVRQTSALSWMKYRFFAYCWPSA